MSVTLSVSFIPSSFSLSPSLSIEKQLSALLLPQPLLKRQQQKPIKYTIRVTNGSLAYYNTELRIFHSDKCSVIFLSSQQAVKTLLSFVTVHMSNWQSAHSIRLEKKNLFNVCPTRRHEVWLAENGEWLLIMCPNMQFQLLSSQLMGSALPIQTAVDRALYHSLAAVTRSGS